MSIDIVSKLRGLKSFDSSVKLPTKYTKLSQEQRACARQQYARLQNHKCYYCEQPLNGPPPAEVMNKRITWKFFPSNFLNYPLHLHHSHITDMTIGVVHAYCNAVLWQHEGE